MVGEWPYKQINNQDVVRMHSACGIMDVDARKSIYNMAINALGKKAVNSDM